MDVNVCTKCGEAKPASLFSKDARKRSGVSAHCKACHAAASVKYRAVNPGKVAKARANWRTANPEKQCEYAAKYRTDNAEKCAAVSAKWRAANPQKQAAASAAWESANSEKMREHRAVYRAANPDKCRIYKQNRRSRIRDAGGRLSHGLADRLFKLQRGKCACGCGQSLGDNYHLDHILPLALGGANEDNNIQLLRQRCNNQKHAKHPIDFMQSRGFLL